MSALRARLARRLRGDVQPGDEGAIAVMFVILLAGGVVMGMLALVIDVGLIYAEREELQSGADSAAIALAEVCARRVENCGASEPVGAAQSLVNDNSRDRVSRMVLCGDADTSNLADCDGLPENANASRCAGARPTDGQPFVEVQTSTELQSGRFALPPVFAASLSSTNVDGTTVGACARAYWGTPKFGNRIAVSECQWRLATNNGSRLIIPPPYGSSNPPMSSQAETVLRLTATLRPNEVPSECRSPSGQLHRYGFGWLRSDETPDDDCITDNLGTQYRVGGGGGGGRLLRDAPDACWLLIDDISRDRRSAEPLTVAIYDTISGSPPRFNIIGMASFIPTGYRFGTGPTRQEASWRTGRNECNTGGGPGPNQQQCIYGYFTKVIKPGELGPVGMKTFGSAVVSLAG